MLFKKLFEHSQDLFDAAIQEFSAAGYDQASINTILKNSGMSKGQFYYHFENKQDLYFALIEILIARKQIFLASVMEPEDFDQDIFNVLRIQIRHGLAFAAEEPQIAALSQAFLREKGNSIYDATLQRFNFQDDAALKELIARAYDRGEISDRLPLPFVQQLVGYLFSHVSDLTNLSSPEETALNLDRLLDFFKHGLAPRP